MRLEEVSIARARRQRIDKQRSTPQAPTYALRSVIGALEQFPCPRGSGKDRMTRTMSNVLVDHLSAGDSARRDVLWIVAFSVLTAGLAQLEIRLPFTPVPVTGQTFAVLLSGAVLGSRRGFLSQALYLAEGAAGLPVFAGGAYSFAPLLGATGGYLWSYPFAAGLAGWLVERGASRKTWRLGVALLLADALILCSGTIWLHSFFAMDYGRAWLLGFQPFLIGEMVKIVLVGISLPRVLNRYAPSGQPEQGTNIF